MCVTSVLEFSVLCVDLLCALAQIQAGHEGGISSCCRWALVVCFSDQGLVVVELLFGELPLRLLVKAVLLLEEVLIALGVTPCGAAADVDVVFGTVKMSLAVGARFIAAHV